MAVIPDPRLGLLSYILSFVVAVLCIIMLSVDYKAYEEILIPSGLTSFWGGSGNCEATKSAFEAGTNIPQYCNNREYWYKYGTWLNWNYECTTLDFGEMIQKDADQFFFITQFDDTHAWYGNCSTHVPAQCQSSDMINNASWTFDSSSGMCRCSKKQSYFAVGVDEMTYTFQHQIWVDKDKKRVVEANNQKIKTEIVDSSGKLFHKFGKGDSITLTVEEWLAVGGVTLDDINPNTGPSDDAEWVCGAASESQYVKNLYGDCANANTGAFYRTTGILLNLELDFQGHSEKEIVCTVVVTVGNGWQSMASSISYIDYPELPTSWNTTGTEDSVVSQHTVDRYRYGVKFRTHVVGELRRFDWYTLQNSLVAAYIYLTIVPLIVLAIAKFGCKHSDVYSKHIQNKGEVEKVIDSRNEKTFMMLQLTKAFSPKKRGHSHVDKSTWLEIAKEEGFGTRESALWPFKEDVVETHELIKESEAHPDTAFSKTVRELVTKADEIGNKYVIELPQHLWFRQFDTFTRQTDDLWTGSITDSALKMQPHPGSHDPRSLFVLEIRDKATVMKFTIDLEHFPLGTRKWTSTKTNRLVDITITPNYQQVRTAALITKMFNRFDVDQNHILSKEEFFDVLKSWSIETNNEKMWDEIDKNHDGVVTVEELLEYLTPAAKNYPEVGGLGKLFTLCLKDKMNGKKERYTQRMDNNGNTYWVDHTTCTTSWTHPRKPDKPRLDPVSEQQATGVASNYINVKPTTHF